jgi:isopentenyl-diphosphate delta-isomerase
MQAASRRLREEMGMECGLRKAFDFIYKASLEQGLTEHEFDHVLVGYSDANPDLNPEEAHDFRWIAPSALLNEMNTDPEKFTVWFRIIVDTINEKMPELLT